MIFTETRLGGAYVVDTEPIADSRGLFTRTFCRREFDALGLRPAVAQVNVAVTLRAGTIRGMHFQVPPAEEAKLVRCTRGAVHDVIVDLRPESPTFLEHLDVRLSAAGHRGLYIPARFAHGYQTLVDDTELTYQASEFYTPDCERALRFDDPDLGIRWPLPVAVVSPKDAQAPLLTECEAALKQDLTRP